MLNSSPTPTPVPLRTPPPGLGTTDADANEDEISAICVEGTMILPGDSTLSLKFKASTGPPGDPSGTGVGLRGGRETCGRFVDVTS